MHSVPKSLRTWFLVHFVVDMIFAIPLMLAPVFTLSLFGFNNIEVVTVRLVSAALFGIGGTSLLMHKKGIESFETMLDLKIVWAVMAMVGLIWTWLDSRICGIWILVAAFAVFLVVWLYYKALLESK